MKKRSDSLFGRLKKCFIVAEISANHGQDLKRALDMIVEAGRCGADAVKFQAYTPDTLTIKEDNKYFRIKHPKWGGQSLYELYSKAYTPWIWMEKLKKRASDEGIDFFATAFDKDSVDLLEALKVSMHKISSFELTDLPLIEYAAKTKKPLILSAGMATRPEIKEAIAAAKKGGAREMLLLKCVSSYPADPADMNLRTIVDMKNSFKLPVGISDHSLGADIPAAAVSLGAVMVEKHFTLSRKIRTPDSFFSIEPEEFKSMVASIRTIESALGEVSYKMTRNEKNSAIFRRSIFIVEDIDKGEKFTERNIKIIRPSYGMKPKYFTKVLGGRAKKNLKRGTPLRSEDVA